MLEYKQLLVYMKYITYIYKLLVKAQYYKETLLLLIYQQQNYNFFSTTRNIVRHQWLFCILIEGFRIQSD